MLRNELKAISKTPKELRVANYMILFGGKDLVGEFFTDETNFKSAYTESGMLHVDFEHGLDPDRIGMKSDDVLGYVDWSTAKVDQNGIFVERVLNRQAKYMEYLETLIEEKSVGTSSQCVPKGSQRKATGEIVNWPLMRDSLTFTPCEPRMLSSNALKSARELKNFFPDSKSLSVRYEPNYQEEITACKTIKELEGLLRDAGGFSRNDAKSLVARIKSFAHGERVQEDEETTKSIATLILNRRF